MKINIDKYTWYTLLWWTLWTVAFAVAEHISFYMPVEESESVLPLWKIWTLETIWLVLGATMMLITVYQYKHHPSKLWNKLVNKNKK